MEEKNYLIFEEELKSLEMEGYCGDDPHDMRVCDFIASMADRHALSLYSKLFFPLPLV